MAPMHAHAASRGRPAPDPARGQIGVRRDVQTQHAQQHGTANMLPHLTVK